MRRRPYVLLSVAASLDGCIDDAGASQLVLSNDEDFDRVDEVRASVDAILVGANTIRADNPRLLVRSARRREQRIADGLPATPVKVTLTRGGLLDPAASFFATGEVDKLVYTTTSARPSVLDQVGSVGTVIDAGDPLDVHVMLADLVDRDIGRLMVEGGGTVHTQLFSAGVVDELQLVFAPLIVGQAAAPRFLNPAVFPECQLALSEVRRLGDVVLLRYLRRQHG